MGETSSMMKKILKGLEGDGGDGFPKIKFLVKRTQMHRSGKVGCLVSENVLERF